MLVIAFVTLLATLWLYIEVPKGFFPQQDTGVIQGTTDAAQDISFTAMVKLQSRITKFVIDDPAVDTVGAFIGGGYGSSTVNNGRLFITLKPLGKRKVSADAVINRLRKKLAGVEGITLYLQASQDIRVGGRSSRAQYQYALQSGDLNELNIWSERLMTNLQTIPQLKDVNSDQQTRGLQANVVVDRDAASRLGVSVANVDNTLYDAFGQRQVSTIYEQYNQHHVVMEVEPNFLKDPTSLQKIYVSSTNGTAVPLASVAKFEAGNTYWSVNHSWASSLAVTLSFNLGPGVSLGDATENSSARRAKT